MITPNPVGWRQRLGALILLLILGIGIVYFLVNQGLVARYNFYQDHLIQQQNRLEQLERMAASREPIQQLIATINQDRNAVVQYLSQATPSVAGAELQQRVKAVVEAAGGTLRSTQALPPADEGNTVKVTVSVNLTGDTETLQKILHEMEAQTPLLLVDNLDVTARENRPRLTNGRVANYSRIQLTVQLEVSGYLRKVGN
ncbi:MAG: type II secretion system protein GspM [Candidatus Competibacter denitrificans]